MNGKGRLAGTLLIAAMASSAAAFGTLTGSLGQNREHERITRRAFACGAPGIGTLYCFEPLTLDEFAGKVATFGAVGAPDHPLRGLLGVQKAHCDGGDYVEGIPYPRTRAAARAALQDCRAWMNDHMDSAVHHAGFLLHPSGAINTKNISITTCNFLLKSGVYALTAKCSVLADLGISLHASQDFYSHTNWSDEQDPAQAQSLTNPVGLNYGPHPAPWLDLRTMNTAFPSGLISGCFTKGEVVVSDPAGCKGRVMHLFLNKDKGTIDPVIGTGSTARGLINTNFDKAVTTAIADTKDKLVTFHERLVEKYGKAGGNRMFCVITHDKPTDAACPLA